MKYLYPILLLFLSAIVSSASPQKKPLLLDYGAFFDGGTIYIEDLRKEPDKSLTLCFDGNEKSATSGNFYFGAVYPSHKDAKLASSKELKQIFTLILAELEEYFGSDTLKEISKLKHPDEIFTFAKKHSEYPSESISNGVFIYHFIHHKQNAEQDGADQPATAPESKPEGDSKPQPESEGRSQ